MTLERQNLLHVYQRMTDGTLSTSPLFVRSTLMPATNPAVQLAGSIHMHPNGRFVYVAIAWRLMRI